MNALPLIGQPWPDQGGLFAGIRLSVVGTHNVALILSADVPESALTWAKAQAWAKTLRTGGFKDWVVPNRFELATLYATVRDQVATSGWFWSNTQYSDASSAWNQYFSYGGQVTDHKSYEGRVRAVRRLRLDPSTLQPTVEVAS